MTCGADHSSLQPLGRESMKCELSSKGIGILSSKILLTYLTRIRRSTGIRRRAAQGSGAFIGKVGGVDEATQQQQYRNKTIHRKNRGVWCLLRMVIVSTTLLKWYVSSQVVLYT